MAHRPHPKGARTNPRNPQGWSTCQRCGFVYNLVRLSDQLQWRGLQLMSINLQVCSTCLDIPQRQLGTIILQPDPPPLLGALPEPYAIDEVWPRLKQGGQPRYLQRSSCSRSIQYLKYYDTDPVIGAGWGVVEVVNPVIPVVPGALTDIDGNFLFDVDGNQLVV